MISWSTGVPCPQKRGTRTVLDLRQEKRICILLQGSGLITGGTRSATGTQVDGANVSSIPLSRYLSTLLPVLFPCGKCLFDLFSEPEIGVLGIHDRVYLFDVGFPAGQA